MDKIGTAAVQRKAWKGFAVMGVRRKVAELLAARAIRTLV